MVVVGVNHHEARVTTIQYGPVGWSTICKNDKLWDKIKCQFLDVHSLKGLDEESLRKAQNSHKDEFGVIYDVIMYDKEEDKFFCLLDAPSKRQLLNIMKNMVFSVTG